MALAAVQLRPSQPCDRPWPSCGRHALLRPGMLAEAALAQRSLRLVVRSAAAVVCHAAAMPQGQQSGHWTLSCCHEGCTEVKKSRFRVLAWPVQSADEAKALIDGAKEPDASHNCWAYQVGSEMRCCDDGEPSGTAGRPMLAAISKSGLDGVACLVIRHFGGTKLGAGGLTRAYGGCVADCLRTAERAFVEKQVKMSAEASFDAVGTIYNVLSRHGATVEEEQYTEGGRLLLCLRVPAGSALALQSAVSNATSGAVVPRLVES